MTLWVTPTILGGKGKWTLIPPQNTHTHTYHSWSCDLEENQTKWNFFSFKFFWWIWSQLCISYLYTWAEQHTHTHPLSLSLTHTHTIAIGICKKKLVKKEESVKKCNFPFFKFFSTRKKCRNNKHYFHALLLQQTNEIFKTKIKHFIIMLIINHVENLKCFSFQNYLRNKLFIFLQSQ